MMSLVLSATLSPGSFGGDIKEEKILTVLIVTLAVLNKFLFRFSMANQVVGLGFEYTLLYCMCAQMGDFVQQGEVFRFW